MSAFLACSERLTFADLATSLPEVCLVAERQKTLHSQDEIKGKNIASNLGDAVATPISNVYKTSFHGPPFYQRGALIEHYIKGHARLHLHLIAAEHGFVGGTYKSATRQYCIVLECPSLADMIALNGPRIIKRRKLAIEHLYGAAGRMERAVLVDIRKLIQMPQWADNILPCRERLKVFNQGCGLLADPFEHGGACAVECSRLKENGELSSVFIGGGAARRMDYQLISNMVQCRSDIVNDLADNHTPIGGTWSFDGDPDGEFVNTGRPAYSVELERRGVGATVDKVSNFILQQIDLLIGPLHLKPDAIK